MTSDNYPNITDFYSRHLGKAILCFLVLFLIMVLVFSCAREVGWASQPEIWKVLMAEAVSERYNGMYAVACVIRNRGGDLRGFAGASRKDLDIFCNKQGQKYIEMAKRIETIVFKNNGKDITDGATHFESIDYLKPKWAYKMKITCQIGKHIFYKESKR